MDSSSSHTPESFRAAIVLAAYDSARWPDTLAAIRSVQAQQRPADEIILVVDHNPELLEQATAELPAVRVMPNVRARGASGARNTGVAATAADVVAFLDDDAVAEPQWLGELLAVLARPDVVGVGGRLLPLWPQDRPRWFPEEFYWVVGASYRGMPEQVAPVRNVWSGSMALRRWDFEAVDGFREGFGKTGNRSRPEDTDLCLRVAEAAPGRNWMYVPTAGAGHRVPPVRAGVPFFFSRCWHEGRGKAELARATARRPDRRALVHQARCSPAGSARGCAPPCGPATRPRWRAAPPSSVASAPPPRAWPPAGSRSPRISWPPAACPAARPVAGERATMRILVDHSGYDLRNLGDAAMLQACVSRLRQGYPDAAIDVVTTDPQRLAALCPGTRPVRSSLGEARLLAPAPRRRGWRSSRSGRRPARIRARPASPRQPADRAAGDPER